MIRFLCLFFVCLYSFIELGSVNLPVILENGGVDAENKSRVEFTMQFPLWSYFIAIPQHLQGTKFYVKVEPEQAYEYYEDYQVMTFKDSNKRTTQFSDGKLGVLFPIDCRDCDHTKFTVNFFSGNYLNHKFYVTFYDCGTYYDIGKSIEFLRYSYKDSKTKLYIDYPEAVKIQDKYCRNRNNGFDEERGLIPFSTAVVNPDNLCCWHNCRDIEMCKVKFAYNPDVYYNGHLRIDVWRAHEDENGKEDFSMVNDYMLKFVKHHARIQLRIAQFSDYHLNLDPYYDMRAGAVWGQHDNNRRDGVLKKPKDFVHNYALYKDFIEKNKISFNSDDELIYKNKLVCCGFPLHLFWDMVKEGKDCYPVFWIDNKNKNPYMIACPNYNSDVYFEAWKQYLKKFSSYLEGNLQNFDGKEYLINGKTIKRRDCIETLQAGFVGMWGEGWVHDDLALDRKGGILPENKEKAYRYADVFVEMFPDIPLSMPLAISYDYEYYGDDGITKLLSLKNNKGVCGLYWDVIGQIGYMPYSDKNSHLGRLLDSLGYDERKIGGEVSPENRDVNNRWLLTNAFRDHYYGVQTGSIHSNVNDRSTAFSPFAEAMRQKFITVVGAKLHLWNYYITENQEFCYDLQNIGMCKLFSNFWTPYITYRDKNGGLLGKEKLNVDLQSIEPNSQDFETVGLLKTQMIKEMRLVKQKLNINRNTKYIYFSIEDDMGIYPNYYLHNYGRTGNGEYLVWSF